MNNAPRKRRLHYNCRDWTRPEIAYLRAHYGADSFADIAAALRRTIVSVKSAATRFGVAKPRRLTQADIDYVIAHPSDSCLAISIALGRSQASITRVRDRLGLARKRCAPNGPAFDAFIKEKHAAGYSDADIAKEWGCERHTVGDHRRLMGLPTLIFPPRTVEKIRAGMRRQCAAAGVANLGQIRALAIRKFVRESGLPADLLPREVQIINFLTANGPSTRKQINAAFGFPWRRGSLSCSYRPEGTHLAHLINRGLVTDLGRVVKGKGSGYSVHLYSVPISVALQRSFNHAQKRSA